MGIEVIRNKLKCFLKIRDYKRKENDKDITFY